MSCWKYGNIVKAFIIFLILHCTKSEITSWSSRLQLNSPIYYGVYATTSSSELYMIGGATMDKNKNQVPLTEYYTWNAYHQSILYDLMIGSSPSISELYSISYDYFACLSTKCAVSMSDDIIYIIGSNYFNPSNNEYNTTYNPNVVITFDTKTDEYINNSIKLQYPTTEGCVTNDIENNLIYYIGGYINGESTGYIQVIDLNNNYNVIHLTSIPRDITVAGTQCLYYNKHLWIFGGVNSDGIIYDKIWIYNIAISKWGESTERLSKPTRNGVSMIGPDGLIYIIGNGNVDIFDPSITRIVDNNHSLIESRYSMAAVAISNIQIDGYKQWELMVFGGLGFNEYDKNNTIADGIPLNSIESAKFIAISTTFYPSTTYIISDDNVTISVPIVSVSETEQKNESEGLWGNNWSIIYWLLIGLGGVAVLITVIMIIRCFRKRNKERHEQLERERRSIALSQYPSNLRSDSDEKHKLMTQQQRQHLKSLSVDIDNLELINRALQETVNMKEFQTTDEEQSGDIESHKD